MTRTTDRINARRLARRAGVAAVLTAAACSTSDILHVDNPDTINPPDVATPAGLSALQAGAIGDYSLAFVGDNGGTQGQILVSGSVSDQLDNVQTFPNPQEIDQRGAIRL